MQPCLPDAKIRCQLHVRGIVQGVGFRPFVYKLATSLGLTGFVFNSSSGVTIEIEGSSETSRTFIDRLQRDPPQLAEIFEVTVSEVASLGSIGFDILESREEAWGVRPGISRRRHLRGLLARLRRSVQPPLRLCLHELHPLWSALHDRPGHSL